MLDIFCLFFTSFNLSLFYLTRYFFPGEHMKDHFIWHLIYWPVQSYVFLISCLAQNSAPLVEIFLSLFQNVCNVFFDCVVISFHQSLG